MAEFNLKLNINGIETAVASVEDLEVALKATKEEMKTLQIGSEAFNVAAGNAQKLDSALKNVKLATEGVDTKQLAGSFAKLGETVTGAFAIATNAVGLFGSKSEAVNEAAVKAQQAIAVVMGARAIAEGVVEGRIAARLILEKVTIANQALMTSLFGAQAVAISAQAVATGEATVAQYALNTAMEANPILLIVAAIGALVGAFVALADSEESEIERTERLNKEKEAELKIINDVIDAYKAQKSIVENTLQNELDLLKASGASKKEIYDKEQEVLDRKIMTLKAVAQSGRDLNVAEINDLNKLQNQKLIVEAQYNADKAKAGKDARDKQVAEDLKNAKDAADKARILQEAADKEALELKKAQAISKQALLAIEFEEEVKYLEKIKNASIAAGNDAIKAEEIFQTAKENARKRFDLAAQADNEQIKDEGLKQEAENAAKITALYGKLNSDRESIRLQGLTGLALIEEKHLVDVENLEKKYADNKKAATELLAGDEVAQKEALLQIDKDYIAAKEAEEDAYEERKKQKQLDNINQYASVAAEGANSVVALLSAIQDGENQERTQKINAQYSAEENALRAKLNSGEITKKEYDKREATLNAAKAKAEYDAKKKAFESEKKLRIASTIISGIMGALQAFTGAMQLGPIAGPIVGGILAGLVVATTAVTVSNISKQQFDGGAQPLTPIDPGAGGDANAAGSAAISSAATGSGGGITSFNPSLTGPPAGSTGTGQGTSTSGPIKVVVVESDITNAQRSVSVAESNATF